MDELKALIEMVAGLPNVVLWVLIGYLVYKLVVVGSIYGIIRLAITQMVILFTKHRTVTHMWHWGDCEVIGDAKPALELLLSKAKKATGVYLNKTDVTRLSRGLDLVEEEERKVDNNTGNFTATKKGL